MQKKSKIHKIQNKRINFPTSLFLILIALLFSFIGLIFVFEASSIKAIQLTGDSFHFLKLQLRWIAFGFASMMFFSVFDYKKLAFFCLPIMLGVIIMLLLVLIPSVGQQVGGARRWIDFGIINIQPTEVAKLAIIIYLASWFSKKEKNRFLPFILLTGFLISLILLQPDMGTAIVILSMCIIIYFLAGQEILYLVGLIPIIIGLLISFIALAPYRVNRLSAFLDPLKDPLGVGFHINQILISLSEGGLTGRGFGASRQKYLFLPEAHTDSIFAIIGEELGFIGSVLIIFFYIVLLFKLYEIYTCTVDKFARLLCGGILAFFGLQVIINLGGMVNLIPLTGIPLPFLSYGGSSIITSFTLLGIAISISKYSKHY